MLGSGPGDVRHILRRRNGGVLGESSWKRVERAGGAGRRLPTSPKAPPDTPPAGMKAFVAGRMLMPKSALAKKGSLAGSGGAVLQKQLLEDSVDSDVQSLIDAVRSLA